MPLDFCEDFWPQKTTVPRLSYGIVCTILYLAILAQYRLVTDGQKDTRQQHIPR